MSFDLPALASAIAAHGLVARIVVTSAAGSVPRGPGTAMLVWKGGSEGTIGGGRLEYEAMDRARAMISSGQKVQARTVPLGPDLGQCCGGQMGLVWEVFDAETLPLAMPYARPVGASGTMPDKVVRRVAGLPRHHLPVLIDGWLVESTPAMATPLWIWGAGHVGRALVTVMAPLPDWAITWVDTDAARFPGTLPDNVATLPASDPALLAAHAPPDAMHVILTYSHAIDLALCDALLRRGAAGVGLIGSATKWARFRKRLGDMGHQPAQIAAITCPIGDPGLGKHPAAIALGVATSLQRQALSQDQQGTKNRCERHCLNSKA